jgi:hypothetical protein
MALPSMFPSTTPRIVAFKMEKQPTKMKGELSNSWNVFDLSDGIDDDDDVMLILGLVIHASPLHISFVTLSNPSTLDDPFEPKPSYIYSNSIAPFKLCNSFDSSIYLLLQSTTG